METFYAIWIVVMSAMFYMLPAMVAHSRKAEDVRTVFYLNLFLGWTVIGWWVALVIAAMKPRRQEARPPSLVESVRPPESMARSAGP
ncbi:MAG: superinfection immunity protein [Myxococcota bacterium]